MHPSASFTNIRPGSLKPKIESFSSSYQVADRFTVKKTSTPTRPGSFRKTSSKSKSDLLILKSLPQKVSNTQLTHGNTLSHLNNQNHWKSSQSIHTQIQETRPSVKSQSSKNTNQSINGTKTPLSKVHLRNQSQNASYKPQDDDNPIINKIPLSPISMKRAMSPQMLGSIDEYTDMDNLCTENSTFESGYSKCLNLNQFPSYTMNNGSINLMHEKPVVREFNNNTALNGLHINACASFNSLHDITNSKGSPEGKFISKLDIHSNFDPIKHIANLGHYFPREARDGATSFSYRPLTEVNNNDRQSPVKIVYTHAGNEIKNGELKSPGRARRDHSSLSMKVKPSPVKNLNQENMRTTNSTMLQNSPPKGRFTSINNEIKNSNPLDGVKTYLTKLNKFNLSKSTSLIRQIFQQKKRLKCSCDISLDENETCSRAMNWIKKKYNPNEFTYLKSTYEKILSENKLVDIEYARQIQKDLPRTSPQNKYFAEGSVGIKSLESILNTFAKYDPQIGYVQGMNFIAASLLYHAEEYIAFWLLVMIFEIFEMRDIYLPKLPGLSKHCQIIDMIILSYQPDIYSHLVRNDIKVQIFCTEWILALFASVIPVENMANFYDLLLAEGWPFFYKIIYAFLEHFEKQIMAEQDLMGILTVLKSQNHMIKNSNKSKNPHAVNWNDLFQRAREVEIDSYFIYKMHSNFDADNQWFRTSFVENK